MFLGKKIFLLLNSMAKVHEIFFYLASWTEWVVSPCDCETNTMFETKERECIDTNGLPATGCIGEATMVTPCDQNECKPKGQYKCRNRT